MAINLDWFTFEISYLRPILAGSIDALYDTESLKVITYSVVADLNAKGIDDVGPPPQSITTPGKAQLNYIFANNVSAKNIFYLTLEASTVSYQPPEGSSVTSESVLTGLQNAIAAKGNVAPWNTVTITNNGGYLAIAGKAENQSFTLYATATKNEGTTNPTLTSDVVRSASPASSTAKDITQVYADFNDAFPMIAAGVKFFVINDPVSKLSTTSGLDISKDSKLVEASRLQYDQLIKAYIAIHKSGANNISAIDYWKSYLATNQTDQTSGLSVADRLAMIRAEGEERLKQIQSQGLLDKSLETHREPIQTRLVSLQKDYELEIQRLRNQNQLDRLELERRYRLEDRAERMNRTATNGVKTLAGEFTISFIEEYGVEMEPTVVTNLKLDTQAFGLVSPLPAGAVSTSNTLNVSEYSTLELLVVSNNPVIISAFYLPKGASAFEPAEADMRGETISRRYFLGSAAFFKLVIQSPSTAANYYVKGEFLP